jgi:membrane protease YdiL (CAAX protease family)
VTGRAARRLAALLEIAGVFLVGSLLARVVSRALDLGPASLRALPPGEAPDFLSLSRDAALNLLLRYGLVLGLAFLVGWWHRRRRVANYGVTAAGHPVGRLALAGVLLFAAAGLPGQGLKLLAEVVPLGPSPQHWALMRSLDQPGIWLYLLVASFGLVPILEELFARGYVQTRLVEDFGAGAGILMTALVFTLSHTQYFLAGLLGHAMLVALFLASVAAGYVRHVTGSLLPAIVAHALGNLPYRGMVLAVVVVVMIALVAIRWRAVSRVAGRLWREVAVRGTAGAVALAVGLCGVVLAQVLFAQRLLPAFAVFSLGAALLLERREPRSRAVVAHP